MSGVCVIGLGLPQGDDQLGWELVRLLEKEVSVDESLRLFTCATPGGEVLECWKDAELAILVDAVRSDAPPGTVRRIALHPQPDLPELESVRTLTSHSLDLRELIALAAALDQLPPHVVLFGVEMGAYAPFEPLSATVCTALPGLAYAVRTEIDSFFSGDELCKAQ